MAWDDAKRCRRHSSRKAAPATTPAAPPVLLVAVVAVVTALAACSSPGAGTDAPDLAAFTADGGIDDVFASSHPDLLPATRQPDPAQPQSWRGMFRINCDYSHSSYNDPIVYPGEENAAHLHRFYGNTVVDHTTTMESLYTEGESSCQGNRLNLSGYWIPALLSPSGDDWSVVPGVVRMIAGDPSATPEDPQDPDVVRWHCQSWASDDADNPRFSPTIPECVAPDRVRMDVFFPSCWNGTDLDTADHRSHMAYPVSDRGRMVCPDTHPVPIARPSYHYAFGVKPEVFDPETRASTGWRLSADGYEVSDDRPGGASLHADWFNGWHPEVMEAIVEFCIRGRLDCHDGNLANGHRLSDVRPGIQNEPVIINNGLGPSHHGS